MRRSRCILLVSLVSSVYLFVWLFFSYDFHAPFVDNFLSLHKSSFDSKVYENFHTHFKSHTTQLSNSDKLNKFKLTPSHHQSSAVTLSHVFANAKHLQNPGLTQFDPRFTLGVILEHLNHALAQKPDLDSLSIPVFSWSDWTDLSALNKYKLNKEKKTCAELFDARTSSELKNNQWYYLDPMFFCLDDSQSEESVEKLKGSHLITQKTIDKYEQLKNDPLSPGFHVFRVPGRTGVDTKRLQSKSYLNDFMPKPLSAVFLLPYDIEDGRTRQVSSRAVKVNIDQGTESPQRLVESEMFSDYRKRTGADKDVTVDAGLQYKAFVEKSKQLLPDKEYLKYERTMSPELFIDNSTEIYSDLFSRADKLSVHEKNYMESIAMSITSPYPLKYFSEAFITHTASGFELGTHYDWRFFTEIVNFSDLQAPVLFGLVKSWFHFTNSYNFNTWLAHGSLLSWFWNGVAFPWDIDFDVQMPIQDLHKICREYNQTIVVDMGADGDSSVRYGRYMLDCGTFISRRIRGNGNNNIDARYIDIDTGLYIDITALAVSETKAEGRYDYLLPDLLNRKNRDANIGEFQRNIFTQVYNCRNNHFLQLDEISPVKLTYFEGQLYYVPNNYKQTLINEYKDFSLIFKKFGSYTYIDQLDLWHKTKDLLAFVKKKYHLRSRDVKKYNLGKASVTRDKAQADLVATKEFHKESDYLEYLNEHKSLMVEYLLTKDLTALHREEMRLLGAGKSTKKLFFDKKGVRLFKPLRHDTFSFKSEESGYDYTKANQEILDLVSDIESKGSIAPKSAMDEDQIRQFEEAKGALGIPDWGDDA